MTDDKLDIRAQLKKLEADLLAREAAEKAAKDIDED